jgi:hypothetical protein
MASRSTSSTSVRPSTTTFCVFGDFDRSHQSHGKGNVRITLEPGRKNLLRLRL